MGKHGIDPLFCPGCVRPSLAPASGKLLNVPGDFRDVRSSRPEPNKVDRGGGVRRLTEKKAPLDMTVVVALFILVLFS